MSINTNPTQPSIVDDEISTLERVEQLGGMEKIKGYMKLQGPAWMSIALNIGGATVTSAVMLGAKTGYKFMWAIIPQVFVIWMAILLCDRITLVTGKGTIEAVREYIGEWAAWLTGASVFIVNLIFDGIQFALIGSICSSLFGGDGRIWALTGLVFAAFIVFMPAKNSKVVNTIITAFLKYAVWLLVISFALVLLFVPINWGELLVGFIPRIPESGEELVIFTGLLGSAIAINVPFLAAYSARQRKWTSKHLGLTAFEVTFTNILLILVQWIVIIVCAATLFPKGIVPKNAIQASLALTPLAGKAATMLFGLGLLGAVFTTIVSQIMVSGYAVAGLMKWPTEDIKSAKFRLGQLIVVCFGASVPLFGWNAFSVTVYGSSINLSFMPIGLIFWWLIANKKDVMGQYVPGKWYNIGVLLSLIMALVATINYWVHF